MPAWKAREVFFSVVSKLFSSPVGNQGKQNTVAEMSLSSSHQGKGLTRLSAGGSPWDGTEKRVRQHPRWLHLILLCQCDLCAAPHFPASFTSLCVEGTFRAAPSPTNAHQYRNVSPLQLLFPGLAHELWSWTVRDIPCSQASVSYGEYHLPFTSPPQARLRLYLISCEADQVLVLPMPSAE